MNIQDIILLPIEIQLSLAVGYAGYLTAFTGIRASHKIVDTVFLIIIFSAISTFWLKLLGSYGLAIAGITSAIITLICAAYWRKKLRYNIRGLMRNFDISWSNDDISAFATLCDDSKNKVYQIAVKLNDDSWLRCDDTTKFEKAPFSPFLIGPNGDVALYLTHTDSPSEPNKEQTTVLDEFYGARITYVPASRIKLINIRHAPQKVSHSLTVEA